MTKLNRLFDQLNKRFWRGRLPKYRVISRGKIPGDALGACRNETKIISLRKDLSEEDLRLTLLHEMCHIGPEVGGDAHGPRFRRKLRRLADLGEPKLVEDIERYDGASLRRYIVEQEAETGSRLPMTSWRDEVRSDLQAAYFAGWATRRWSTIRRWLARRYKISEAGLERRIPWAQREWRRYRSEAHEDAWVRQAVSEGRWLSELQSQLRKVGPMNRETGKRGMSCKRSGARKH